MACPVLTLGPEKVQALTPGSQGPQSPKGGVASTGTALPTDTRCPKVSNITSWYSVLCIGSSSPHSSLLKSTATSRKVTGSCNITLCVCSAGGSSTGTDDWGLPTESVVLRAPLLWSLLRNTGLGHKRPIGSFVTTPESGGPRPEAECLLH